MPELAQYLEDHNESRRVGSFLDWAHQKITAEMKQIEEMEKEYGTAEWYTTTNRKSDSTPGVHQPRTRSQKIRIIEEIDELRRDGSGLRPAAKLCGISGTTYLRWREQLGLGKFNGGEGVST